MIHDSKVWLAPLAGFTDQPFRTICKENGAEVMVTEMVSADGLIHEESRSIRYADFLESHRPIGVQLFGSEPDIMAKAAILIAEKRRPDFIDVNMGCPVKKVVNRGAGSALMKTPEQAGEIIRAMKRALEGSGIPLTVKIRSGWDAEHVNAVEVAKILEDSGADVIAVHPRTRNQMYSGNAEWGMIAKVKETVSVPVVGNGDIRSPEDAMRMMSETGCDFIMIGRGALGKPWLFAQTRDFLLTGVFRELSYHEKYEIVAQHLRLALDYYGIERGIREMRTHLHDYTKGFRGGAKIRQAINHCDDPDQVLTWIRDLLQVPRNKI